MEIECARCGNIIKTSKEIFDLKCNICGSKIFRIIFNKKDRIYETIETIKIIREGVYRLDIKKILEDKVIILSAGGKIYSIFLIENI